MSAHAQSYLTYGFGMDDCAHVVARLGTDPDGDVGFEPFGELTTEAYAQVIESLSAVRRSMQFDLMQIVMRNLEDHQELVADMNVQASGAFALNVTGSARQYREVLASTLNFCSSVHSFQEHAEVRVRRLEGPAGRDEVHAMFADAYDRAPDLFLVRKLRNVMVHNTLEIVGYQQEVGGLKHGAPGPGRAKTTLDVDALLRLTGVFNERLRSHLQDLGPEPDLLSIMARATDALADLNTDLVVRLFPDLMEHARRVDEFLIGLEQLGADPAQPMLIVDYSRETDLPLALETEAVAIRPETTTYARGLVHRRPHVGGRL